MKRVYKNIILISLGVLLVGATIFTVVCAKNDIVNSQPMMGMGGGMENPSGMGTPPEKPDSEADSNDMGTPPEKPDGESNSNNMTPPEKPSDDNTQSMPSDGMMMGENPNTISADLSVIHCVLIVIEILLFSLITAYLIMSKFNQRNLKETFATRQKIAIYILASVAGTIVLASSVILITNNFILNFTNNTPNNMNASADISYSAVTEITESTTINSGTYESTKKDENVLAINGKIEVTANNITVNKTGNSDGGDNTSFYGTNSAIIARNGAILNLKNATITTDATGANGVFSYGGSATTNNSTSDGTTINISDSAITTKKDNSGGIMTTGGGIMNASNLTIETAGTSSAAIRSDRGGGTVNVDGGTYKTTGQGSPSIYSTANITVKNATLISTTSEGAIIEGKNTINLENVTLTDSNTKLNGQSTTYKNIFLYQSMSGDADNGTSEFTAKNSTITTNNGDSFYITNTTAKITLTNNKITNNDNAGNFLRIKADSWGQSGSNGGTVALNMDNQEITGNIVVDSISTLDINMESGSTYIGTINGDNTGKEIKLKLDGSSKITLTGDSHISSLEDADATYNNINFNGHKLYVSGKAIN